ncbi:indolepyruvate ferredoxin oxidoreductase family protein [Alcaligenaceae bacterium]|nr:indolepyruvate ferredoxin oxidoreductase family protein [Alcaligenaceae bacterium]
MNAPIPASVLPPHGHEVSLDDKYTLGQGRVYMSGTQALVRLPMLQKARDRDAGLNTAGFISGYRGSPLGALDQALWQAKSHLKTHDIVFQPGVNEDLAATACWGTQQVNLYKDATHDGVFGMWYGKGPGVDRSMDVLKHANAAGTSRHGGVLVLAGDDHAAKSSTVAHQSEHNLMSAGIPVFYPANVQEYLDFGLHGWAMSRYTGLWVGMKCVTEVVESTASVDVDPRRPAILLPEDFPLPADGLNLRWPDSPLVQEARLLDHKLYAALAYVRRNRLNPIVLDSPQARFGIMAAGKAYLDTREALRNLGLDDDTCRRIGVRIMKVGCVWPMNAQDAREFATGLQEILVVEEKRQILEYALKEELYNWRDDVRPRVSGKFADQGDGGGEWAEPRGPWLLTPHADLSPALIARAIALRLERIALPEDIRARIAAHLATLEAKARALSEAPAAIERKPWFCSGCPHNTSTRVPEGSRAMAGIGCHYMSIWMDRRTETFSHMGGEGAAWTGQQHFTREKHVFVNLGDGTYFHSGLLAIRAAVAAKASITYKILYNDAVAMTGGQPVDGSLTVPDIVAQVAAEGVRRVVIVTDEPEKYKGVSLAGSPPVHHRDELDRVQRELREVEGTTVLVYDQTCATEKRRRRKRGTYPDPARRAYINTDVCEGCGDCSTASNCLSVEPVETPRGTKRRINQSSCNKDFSCVKGYCPSFVTLEGAQPRKPRPAAGTSTEAAASGADGGQAGPPAAASLPQPALPDLDGTYGILVTGIGGTGVVTIGNLLGMAAHLENKGVNVLDMAGLAQKGGAVTSHIQIAAQPSDILSTRVPTARARLLLGCDAIVSTSADVLDRMRPGHTQAIINDTQAPTAEIIHNPSWRFPAQQAQARLRGAIGDQCEFMDASALALALLGDTIYANPLILGYAWQKGWIPLEGASLRRAIELNGVAVDRNLKAFEWGRQAAHEGAGTLLQRHAPVQAGKTLSMPETLDQIVERNEAWLTAYQNAAYARRYRQAVDAIREKGSRPLTEAVAHNLAKLMAYKDEYEVARLYTDPVFLERLREAFEGEPGVDYALQFHMAPPRFAERDEQGRPRKRAYGPWMLSAMKMLARMRGLRGTALDPFGRTEERRRERRLVEDYLAMLDEFTRTLDDGRLAAAIELARLPEDIRGYGHVKEAAMDAADERRKALFQRYRNGEAMAAQELRRAVA